MDQNVEAIRGRIEHIGQAFANNCRFRRVALGMPQELVSAKLKEYGVNWHQTVVAKVESGGRKVKLQEAYALAEVYRVTLDALVSGQGLDRIGTLRAISKADGETQLVPDTKPLPQVNVQKARVAGPPKSPSDYA